MAAFKQANRHVWWEDGYRRRCRRYGLTPFIVSFTREDVINQYGDACFYCPDGAFEQIDHCIPVAAGGLHVLANARPSCTTCNHRKRTTIDRDDIKAVRAG